jgi:phosphoribosylanthranilate isomerase
MKYPENIQQVAQLLPDYLGFIFYDKSPRYFEFEIPKFSETIQKVGVFVNASLDEILNKIKQYDLQLVQLHGNESPEFCNLLKHINVKIIKVFAVDDDFHFEEIQPFENVCDYFLFDTKGKSYGGNGVAFDWQVLKQYPSKKPFFLSGGIGLGDIEKIKQLHLPIHAIDVNSKFEMEPGLKNIQQLIQLQNELSR